MRFSSSLFTRAGSPLLALVGMGLCGALLAACQRGRTHEAGLEWKGAPMEIVQRLDDPASDPLNKDSTVLGVLFRGAIRPHRLWTARTGDAANEAPDSISLLDYGSETNSYLVFQELAQNADDFAQGFAITADRVYFRRGTWIGSTASSRWKGIADLSNNLSVPGAAAGADYALPAEFNSLIGQQRVEGSERIVTGTFLGLAVPVPQTRIYAAQYPCRGDTAWLYASATLPPDFGKRVAQAFGLKSDSGKGNEQDLRFFSVSVSPVHLRFSGEKMAGVEGCFDDSLTDFWIKMQTRALKKLK